MESNISLFEPSRTPYWYLQWTDPSGRKKQKSSRCKEKSEALKVLTAFKAFIKERQKPLSFSAFAEEFLASNEHMLSPASITLYKSAFRNFKPVCNAPLHRITSKAWDDYKARRLKLVSAVTVNKELHTLRAAMSTALRWRLIDVNPFKGQALCRIVEADAAFITVKQLKCILGAIRNDRIRDITTIAFNTGMRLGEIVALQWKNIDFVSGLITIRNDANFKTKTGKQRAIPMNTDVTAALRRRFEARTDEGDMIFPHMRGGFASRSFKAVARKVLGKNTPVHFHSLRHSFCTALLGNEANVRVVQTLAGH